MMAAQAIADRHNAGVKPGVGHNTGRAPFARDALRSYVERIEKLAEERQTFTDDINDLYKEAASKGFDRKQLRRLIALRKQDAEKRAEEDAILDTYKLAMGMLE